MLPGSSRIGPPEQRDWFHHADQGTQTFGIPYEWFIALEQPSLSLTAPGTSERSTISRPLRIHSLQYASTGKPELPIGFAHGGQVLDVTGAPLRNPQTNAEMTSLGLTCAACHTGRFTYQGTTCPRRRRSRSYECPEFPEGRWPFHRLHALGAMALCSLRRPRPRPWRERRCKIKSPKTV